MTDNTQQYSAYLISFLQGKVNELQAQLFQSQAKHQCVIDSLSQLESEKQELQTKLEKNNNELTKKLNQQVEQLQEEKQQMQEQIKQLQQKLDQVEQNTSETWHQPEQPTISQDGGSF